jgi:hypothetical protein
MKHPLASFLCLMLPLLCHAGSNLGASPEAHAILVSPMSVTAGSMFHVMVTSEKHVAGGEIGAASPLGPLTLLKSRSGGGPPFWFTAAFNADQAGEYHVHIKKGGTLLAFKSFRVTVQKKSRKPDRFIWNTERSWDRSMENLYSAWLERLFMQAEEGATWNPLHEVMRDPEKNILHNHLGLGEDDKGGKNPLIMTPDCADNPSFLRAYFAWKLGLPHGFHECSRGSPRQPPQCDRWDSNQMPYKPGTTFLQAFQSYLLAIKDSVHSGSARTSFTSETSDFYPIPLARLDLRSGVVFADPYGHTLTVVRWIPQTEKNPGLLLAVDAQPDGTIGIKRFWRGSFFFSANNGGGEPGFKAHRPIILENGENRLLGNSEIASHGDYDNYALDQKGMDPSIFYDTMERLINPAPLDPIEAFSELHKAVHERLLSRVTAVANGERHMKDTNYRIVPMPSGPQIFQTTGPWEDFSSPSRDLRLLVALDVLLDFPERVMRNPKSFRLPSDKKPADVKKELQKLQGQWAHEISIAYTASDGDEKTLTLGDIINRMEALEMGYNPNDCVEIRWGTPEGSVEYDSCQRRAPKDQRSKMIKYRTWFQRRIILVQ